VNKTDLDRAYLAGISARQAGKPREANAYRHRRDRDGELLQDRWDEGWGDQDARNRGVPAHGMD
jgi:hypothetical protein